MVSSKIPKLNTKKTELIRKISEPASRANKINTSANCTNNKIENNKNTNQVNNYNNKENPKQAVKQKITTTTSTTSEKYSSANSSPSMVKKPKTLKPTVFNQPYRPPPTPSPVKKLRNPPRITFIKPVQRVVVTPKPLVVNSNTFDKESCSSNSVPVLQSPVNQSIITKRSSKHSKNKTPSNTHFLNK